MPTPLGPVMKAWVCPCSRGFPYHLPRVVDPVSDAIVSTECAEIGHAYAIRAGDEGMVLPVGSSGVPYHLPRVVDPVSVAMSPPSVPRSVMPTPLGPVMKAWICPLAV